MSKFNIKQFVDKLTPEYFAELEKQSYEDDRNYPENFSNWYSCIKDFGKFRHAKIISNQIFTSEEVSIMRKEEDISKVDFNEIQKILKPTLDKMENHKIYSIKNGCFSNKFDFNTCLATKENLAEKLWEVNYASSLFDTGGYTELVVREYLSYDVQKIATIYNGMPLREELRVFYNMDTQQIEYMVDYCNYDYCIEHMPNKTDYIIFNWFHNKIRKRHEQHNHEINVMKEKIKERIDTLKIEGLTGIWSIDFMNINDIPNLGGIWLIDMARGFRSAYWDANKLLCNISKR